MKPLRVAMAAAAAALLAACAGDVVTSPENVTLQPLGMVRLHAPQSVALRNAYPAPARHEIIVAASGTWVIDQRQITDTAIVGLRRALENQGIRAAPESAKSVTLRVQVRGGWAQIMPANVAAKASLALEARLGDGSIVWIDAEDGSAFGMTRAFEGATRNALQRLLLDPRFVAYLNAPLK